jgi:hypothetical protein
MVLKLVLLPSVLTDQQFAELSAFVVIRTTGFPIPMKFIGSNVFYRMVTTLVRSGPVSSELYLLGKSIEQFRRLSALYTSRHPSNSYYCRRSDKDFTVRVTTQHQL